MNDQKFMADTNIERYPFEFEAQTLVELLQSRANLQPDETLYTFLRDGEMQEQSWTYAQLDQKARAIGARLQQLGARGERVLLLYPPGLDYIAGFFGCLYAGAVAVPIMPPRRNKVEERLLAVAADAGAKVALTTQKIKLTLKLKYTFSSAFNGIKLEAGTQISDKLAAGWTPPELSGDSLALLQYTSGSTGTPKGVMVSHGNLLHNSDLIKDCFESDENSRGLIWLPFYHDMGLIGGVLQPLFTGFPVVFMSPIDFLQKPARWLHAISTYGSTISGGPNFAYELCIKKISSEQRVGLDLTSWRIAFTGAEPIRSATLERFAKEFEPYGFDRGAFHACYGLAESTVFAAGSKSGILPKIQVVDSVSLAQNQVVSTLAVSAQGETPSTSVVGCGEAWGDQTFRIVEPQHCIALGDEQIGEIWVSGPSVAAGYWNRPQATHEAFEAVLADGNGGPYLRTGDLGYRSKGELFVTGRLKDLIIIRGKNYYPHDIEQTVEAAHPALRAGCTAAFSVDVEGEEKLVIVQEVTRQAVRKLNVAEVAEAIRTVVSQAHDLPVYGIQLLRPSRIPKTSSGKIQRRASKNGYLKGSLEAVGQWDAAKTMCAATSTASGELTSLDPHKSEDIQRWIATTLANKANMPVHAVDLNRSFVDYGLDSVAAVDLVQDLNDWLDGLIDVDPTILWDFPTVESLVNYLAQQIEQKRNGASAQTVASGESSSESSGQEERSQAIPLGDSLDDADLDDDAARLEALLK